MVRHRRAFRVKRNARNTYKRRGCRDGKRAPLTTQRVVRKKRNICQRRGRTVVHAHAATRISLHTDVAFENTVGDLYVAAVGHTKATCPCVGPKRVRRPTVLAKDASHDLNVAGDHQQGDITIAFEQAASTSSVSAPPREGAAMPSPNEERDKGRDETAPSQRRSWTRVMIM